MILRWGVTADSFASRAIKREANTNNIFAGDAGTTLDVSMGFAEVVWTGIRWLPLLRQANAYRDRVIKFAGNWFPWSALHVTDYVGIPAFLGACESLEVPRLHNTIRRANDDLAGLITYA